MNVSVVREGALIHALALVHADFLCRDLWWTPKTRYPTCMPASHSRTYVLPLFLSCSVRECVSPVLRLPHRNMMFARTQLKFRNELHWPDTGAAACGELCAACAGRPYHGTHIGRIVPEGHPLRTNVALYHIV